MTEFEEFEPREQFVPFHTRTERWTCITAHRRAGKTLACILDLITRAMATKKRHARYAYLAPFFSQAKSVGWDYLKRYAAPFLAEPPKETELSVTLTNGAKIRLFGADNPTALRGMYLDGVVLDEAGDMRRSVWEEVIRPMLSDRMGWAVFIGTPQGQNYFYDIYQMAGSEPGWLQLTLKASETGLINEVDLADARRQMTPSAYRQEYECDFYAPVIGAIYGDELQQARDEGRIRRVAYDPVLPVNTAWDLGMGDSTAILFWQQVAGEYRLIDYLEASGEGLPYYAKVLQDKGYIWGRHFAPHDIRVRELGSGLSRLEVAQSLGINFEIVPNVPIEDGINAARITMARCYFDEEAMRPALDALAHYRREYNDKLRAFGRKPLHDWSSHTADAFRYFALVSRTSDVSMLPPVRRMSWAVR